MTLEERLDEMCDGTGASLIDMDRLLLAVGYDRIVEEGVRIYEKDHWISWTFKEDQRLIPVGRAKTVAEYLREKLTREGKL